MASSREEQPATVWVLDTHTKGTGANMVPLERVLKHGSDTVRAFEFPPRSRPEPAPAEPRAPYRFKVLDVMTRQAMVEDVDARGAVKALRAARSIVDVTVHVYDEEAGRWKRLTFAETKALWEHRSDD